MQVPPSSQIDQPRPRFSLAPFGRFVILGLALFVVACAGASTTGGASTGKLSATPTFISTSGNQLVTTVEEKPVPGAVTVHVTEVEFAIMPSITSFKPGVHYYFVVTNKGTQTHAFTFVPTNADGTPMDEYYQYDHMLIGLNTIPPGTTQTINYTFSASDAGHYEMACRMRGHYMAGMHVPALVL